MTEDELLERLGYAPGSKGERWASVGCNVDRLDGGYMIWKCADGWHVLGNGMGGMLMNGRGAHIVDNPEHIAPTFIDALIYIDTERYGDSRQT